MDTFVQQLINGLTIGSIYALIALGYTMVYGILRLINFAHGDIYMVGAYAGLCSGNCTRLFGTKSFGFQFYCGNAHWLNGDCRRARNGNRAFRVSSGQKIFENDDADYGNRNVAFDRISVRLFFEGKPRSFPQLLPITKTLRFSAMRRFRLRKF